MPTMTVNYLVLMVLCLNGVFTTASSLLADDVKIEIVTLHNTLRRHFANGADGATVANMAKLKWTVHLENAAQETLNFQCDGSFLNINRNFNSNLKTNSIGQFTTDILSWYSEIKTSFYPVYGACWPYEQCRHAYTLLNAKHTQIGCAYRPNCKNDLGAFLCLYDGGSFPFYENGAVCTRCTDNAPFCDDGLCVPCDSTSQDCVCRKSCNHPGVGLGELNTSSCTCNCQYGMGPDCDEPCGNPEQFVDYDICEEVSTEMCSMPEYEDMMNEFCPAKCSCSPFPET